MLKTFQNLFQARFLIMCNNINYFSIFRQELESHCNCSEQLRCTIGHSVSITRASAAVPGTKPVHGEEPYAAGSIR